MAELRPDHDLTPLGAGHPGCTRRGALRGLATMGAATTSAALLTSGAPASAEALSRSAGPGGGPESWVPAPVEDIVFDGPRGTLLAAWAPASPSLGGVLLLHENRGLDAHYRSLAGRLAASGYSALALDMLSEEGGTASFPDPASVAAALSAMPLERFDADMAAALDELRRRLPREDVDAVGFGFGGGMVWRLLTAGADLTAAAPVYGPFPDQADLSGTSAAVLGIYGGLDDRVNASRDAAARALQAARLQHTILTFESAGHAFFNDTGARYDPAAAAEAWRRIIGWFDEHRRGRPR